MKIISKCFFTTVLLLCSFIFFAQQNMIDIKNITTRQLNPLYVVNNEIINVTDGFIKNLNQKYIKSVNVLQGDIATKKYGLKAINGAILITTQKISKVKLKKMSLLYALNFDEIYAKKTFDVHATITDCNNLKLNQIHITNLNSKKVATTDSLGNFKIQAGKNDVLEIQNPIYVAQRVLISNKKAINIKLETAKIASDKTIILKKPVVYLYPKTKTAISFKLHVNGTLQTTFPKYEGSWEIDAYPDGKIFDHKTKRFYDSLFWDGEQKFNGQRKNYQNGFVVAKADLIEFLIQKLEQIGLNTSETNDFVQYWLPILEKNEFNFIRFLVNEDYNIISTNEINPIPDSNLRIFMEFCKTNAAKTVVPQLFSTTRRTGFVLVEWGGSNIYDNEFLQEN